MLRERLLAFLLFLSFLGGLVYAFESASPDYQYGYFYFLFLINVIQHIYFSRKTVELEKTIKKLKEPSNE